PSQVAFLALTVLAASRMDVGGPNNDGVASTNYYARLNELLGLDASGAPLGWSNSAFERLWTDLKHRIAVDLRGLLAAGPGPTTRRYVWYPISQSLLSRRDARRLS